MKNDFITELYSSVRAVWGGKFRTKDELRRELKAQNKSSVPFQKGRTPKMLADVLKETNASQHWETSLAQVQIITKWAEITGPQIAAHTTVIGCQEQKLIVACDSTVWTTELRRLSFEIITKIKTELPESNISELIIQSPKAPNWSHGRRKVHGARGPRDTYG